MATAPMSRVMPHLLVTCWRDGATDGELLGRFLDHRDDGALAALVRRHGPMVWRVCCRLLRNHCDAEDAFQAAFLVLVQKARTLPDRETVGNWLYGVAYQTAVRMRALAAKRGARERQAPTLPEPTTAEQYVWNDLVPVLDEELSRLPDKYRALIVLCDLEDKTRKEVARQLSIPEGTVASRLAAARTMLAKRLARRGVVGSGVLLGAVLSSHAASASVPAPVISSAISAATLVAAGRATAGASPTVAALVSGVTKAMFMNKIKSALVVLVAVLCVGAGVGLLKWPAAAAQQPGAVTPPQLFAIAPVPKDAKPPVWPYAHFRFDGNAKNEGTGEAEFKLRNTKFTDGALELNGVYEIVGFPVREEGYKAICETPKMDCQTFSVVMRFKAEEFGEDKSHLISGGIGTERWLGLSRSPGGNLALTTNTGRFRKEIEGAKLEQGKWTVVACSVDVPGQRVILALNGKQVAVLDFPKHDPLKIEVDKDGRDYREWTFTDYENVDTFHGLVDELRLYERALSEKELEAISLSLADNKGKPGEAPAKGGPAALEQKLVGAWIGHGACVGNAVFHADGTYHNYGYGPGAGHYEVGTWKIDWSELPPTLELKELPTEAHKDPKPTKYFLMKLSDKDFVYRWTGHEDARLEEHRRGTETDDAVVRIRILDGAVQRYLGNEKHGAGVKLPPDLKTLVDTKILPTNKLLLDPWGGEIRYDVTGKNNKGKKPDIWIETKDKKVIGNWQEEK